MSDSILAETAKKTVHMGVKYAKIIIAFQRVTVWKDINGLMVFV